ncbi:MAG: hypothetical protein RL417_730 [Pseudomonadota bacterium]|jgi:hypothetical protein
MFDDQRPQIGAGAGNVSPLHDASINRPPLPDFPDGFYRETVRQLLPLFGSYEYNAYDYTAATHELNKRCHLNLNPDDIATAALMLTALSQTQRFKGELHLEPYLGENTAVHSGHCVILATDMFRRARLTKPERQTPEVLTLHRELTLGCLVHDMGEILGEFTTLSQRAQNAELKEIPEIERRVIEVGLHLAAFSVQEREPAFFYRRIAELRDRARIGKPDQISVQALGDLLDQFAGEVLPRCVLGAEARERTTRFMRLFDTVEMRDTVELTPHEQFVANAVKVIEHTQGIRHLMRFCTKGADYIPIAVFSTPTFPSESDRTIEALRAERGSTTVPISLMTSYRIRRGMDYTESGIPEMFHAAQTDAERALAREIRDACYETMIEWLNANNPYFDRTATKMPEDVVIAFHEIRNADLRRSERVEKIVALTERLAEISTSLSERFLKDPANASTRRLLDVESNERLMSLYLHARKVDYIPELGAGPVGLLNELPPELREFPLVDWEKRRGHQFRPA